jgi:tRNA dimethylallyltransferase
MSKLITILGPTATGKTRLAALTAAKINGEIISADSRQVYRGMDIGTGKDLDDYIVDGVKIPYHLIDIVEPGYEYNVFEFQKDFLKAFTDIVKRNKQPLLCGGTGLYIASVLSGYRFSEVPENKELRKRLENLSQEQLVEKLNEYGKPHNTTDTTDRKRTIRAIEIKEYEKNYPNETLFPEIDSLNIGIHFERSEIRKRITDRLKYRLKNGMTEEVENLLKKGLKPSQLTFYGLEYRYVTLYVTGKIDYETMFEKLNTAIHQFAKRQTTWYRRMEKNGTKIHWINGTLPEKEKLSECLRLIREL